MMHSIFLVANI